MFSYSDISRWLTVSIDPISCEDWLANRGCFGPVENPTDQERDLEIAYLIEQARNGKISGGKDLPIEVVLSGLQISGSEQHGNVWLLAPTGSVDLKKKTVMEMVIKRGSDKSEKKTFGPGEIFVTPLERGESYDIKIGLNGNLRIDKKDSMSAVVTGVEKLVIDTRGRPTAFWPGNIQKEKLKVWRRLLNA